MHTIKVIAQHSGISEGVIYRHFESKDQLFFEAVVEPLQRAVGIVSEGTVKGFFPAIQPDSRKR